MRRWTPMVLLCAVVVGCGPATPDEPLDPSLGTVTMEVRGMT